MGYILSPLRGRDGRAGLSASVPRTLRSMLALPDHDLASLADQFRAWGCNPAHARRVLRTFYENSGNLDATQLEIGHELHRRLAAHPQRRSRVLTSHASSDGTLKLL